MKKLWLMVLLAALSSSAFAQLEVPNPIPNDTVTGTTVNKLVKYNTTASATSGIITAITDKTGAVGVCADGCATSGKAAVISFGAASLVIDNTAVPNDYVTISSSVAGDGHDFGSSCPTDGSQVVGTIFGAGGAAGTYAVDLKKGLCPAASATAPICSAVGSADTITTATSFATVCPIPATAISGGGQILQITVHGVLTTTTTASPVSIMRVDYGASTGVCQHSGTIALVVSQTNVPWDAVCYLQIVTTGAPGTAIPWGVDEASTSTGGTPVSKLYCNAATCSASTVSVTTNSTQNVAITQTATLVSGESFTLQSLVVRNY